ncbi:MAG: oxaloacetate decarboxylase subunit alpha, partial [Dethiobacteria bacterium]|nr:oxaloacetate decarboxylase subunit alpha [Dethiobacteria bacterium]
MISNLSSQLAEQKATHLLKEVLAEVPRVRADLGYPPLVTPSSQIVGSQAVVNVLTGERYKMVSTEIKNYLRGLYGKPPGEINPDLLKKVLKDEQPITGRPADLLKPQLEEARKEIAEYIEQDEDLLSYIIFPNVAVDFFKRRRGELPPLELNSSCVNGKVVNSVKGTKRDQNDLPEDAFFHVDETLIMDEDDFKAYPAG